MKQTYAPRFRPTTFDSDIRELGLTITSGGLKQWTDIQSQKLLIAVDGSSKDSFLTYGIVVEYNHENLKCAGTVPSHPEEANSHQAELGGICMVLLVVLILKKHNDIEDIYIYCDNKMAVKEPSIQLPKQFFKNFDLIQHIFSLTPQIQNLHIIWIKAHQDKKKAFHLLSRPAQLNVLAD